MWVRVLLLEFCFDVYFACVHECLCILFWLLRFLHIFGVNVILRVVFVIQTYIHTYVQYIFIFIIFCSFIFIPSHHDWCWRIVDTGIFFFTVVVFSYVVVVICFDFFSCSFFGRNKMFWWKWNNNKNQNEKKIN